MILTLEFTRLGSWCQLRRTPGALHILLARRLLFLTAILIVSGGLWPLLAALDREWQIHHFSAVFDSGSREEVDSLLRDLATRTDSVARSPALLSRAASLAAPSNGTLAISAEYYLSRHASQMEAFATELLVTISREEEGPGRDRLISLAVGIVRASGREAPSLIGRSSSE